MINITNNCEQGGLEKALQGDSRPGCPIKFDDCIKSQIVAMVCSDAAKGYDRWTLNLLKENIEQQDTVKNISKESIRLILQKHALNPGQKIKWCIGHLDAEYIRRMEDILSGYEREYDSKNPVI